MPDRPSDLEQLVALKRRVAAAIEWHDGMGAHAYCPACDVVDILRGGTP